MAEPLNFLQIELAEILKITLVNDDKNYQRLASRMIGLGFYKYCSRCGGCGHYSFNGTHSLCYKCSGPGKFAVKVTPKVIAEAKQLVTDGKLDSYLTALAETQRINRIASNATKSVMKAWTDTGISALYSWQKASQDVPLDREMSDCVNRPMFDAYTLVSNKSNELQALRYQKPVTKEDKEALDVRIEATVKELATLTTQALETIRQATTLIPEIQSKHKESK